MVSSYGVIEGGVVVNAVLSEADFAADQGWVLLPEGVGPTWLYDGSTFSAPPPYAPSQQEQEAKRAEAYAKEADPLFFKAQRGEATVEEWQAKVAEIRVRFPYPSE
jgi:hypothetical protein